MRRRYGARLGKESGDTLDLSAGFADLDVPRSGVVKSARLYAIPGSHPSAAVGAMLEGLGIEYERVDLVPVLSRLWLRLLGFRGSRVPAFRYDGELLIGSGAIMRALAGGGERTDVEAWGEETLQGVARRIALWGLARSKNGTASVLAASRLHPPVPRTLALLLAPALLRLDGLINGATAGAVAADLARLPEYLERIDAWIAGGELGSEARNIADYQIAGSLRLLLIFDDLAPLFDRRPAADLARRVIPQFPGRVPAGLFPTDWLRRA